MESESSLPPHKSPLLVPIINQTNPIHTIASYFLKIYFNIIIRRISRSSRWFQSFWFPTKILYTFLSRLSTFCVLAFDLLPSGSEPSTLRVKKKTQLDATEWFIARIICSTCFGHFYAHHQELETTCLLLPPMVYNAWLLVVGGQKQGSRLWVRNEGCWTTTVVQHPSFRTHSLLPCFWPSTTSNQALYTIGGSNKHIVSSSWWWA